MAPTAMRLTSRVWSPEMYRLWQATDGRSSEANPSRTTLNLRARDVRSGALGGVLHITSPSTVLSANAYQSAVSSFQAPSLTHATLQFMMAFLRALLRFHLILMQHRPTVSAESQIAHHCRCRRLVQGDSHFAERAVEEGTSLDSSLEPWLLFAAVNAVVQEPRSGPS